MGDTYRFRSQLHIALIYFDEIVGPRIITIHPPVRQIDHKTLQKILQQLLDIGSLRPNQENQFMYSDSDLSSNNLCFNITHADARGGTHDFMISLIGVPTYPELISAMAMDWNSLYELMEICIPLLSEMVINENASHRVNFRLSPFQIIREW